MAWLVNASHLLDEVLAGLLGDDVALQGALQSLRLAGLADVSAEHVTFNPLPASLARRRLDEEQRRRLAVMATMVVDHAFGFDPDDPRTWSGCSELMPHALAVVEHTSSVDTAIAAGATLLNSAGHWLYRMGRFGEARELLDRALTIGYRVFGEDNPRRFES